MPSVSTRRYVATRSDKPPIKVRGSSRVVMIQTRIITNNGLLMRIAEAGAASVAEAEYDANPEGLLRMLYGSPDTPRHPPVITDQHKDAGGWIGRWGMPKTLPQWLSEEDLEYYVGEFSRAGFRGGVNYYRNFDRNHELMEKVDPVVRIPALFIVGDKDLVIAGMDREQLEQRMRPVVPHLRHIEWLEGAGHWIQQERPQECNQALLAFLQNL